MRTHHIMSSTTTSSEAVKLKKFANGGYFTYYDLLICPTSAHMVHEYADRKELMWIDESGKEHFVKTL
jgi:hypothetical protein